MVNQDIVKYFEMAENKTLKRDTKKYNESLYVKYLTPVEQIGEIQNFLDRIKDFSFLEKKKSKKTLYEDESDIEYQIKELNRDNLINT